MIQTIYQRNIGALRTQ